MNDESNNKKGNKVIGIIIRLIRPYLIGLVIIVIFLGLLAGLFHFFTKQNGIEDPDDKKNGPAAARSLINNTNISGNGNIEFGETIQETWDNLKKQGNALTNYLSSAQELAKLITAASALDYPDTRKNPDTPIDWNDIDVNSRDVQGIVKFKRALSDGTTITMRYVSPSEFNKLVNNYLSSGSEKDRNEALKYFTVERSFNAGDNGIAGKVTSLKNMVFMGDSILQRLSSSLQKEGSITMHKSGCTAKYFLGKETVNIRGNCIEKNGYFDWEANFKNITNPTGFYLVLGQNFYGSPDRIEQMNDLVEKIKSQYPSKPIYISSVLNTASSDSERKATAMNEELKNYCSGKENVYYSDILRGYKENLIALTEDDNDHPNARGVQVLIKNIKENIISSSSSGQSIVAEAEKYVGKLPYVWGGQSLESGADCSGFVWAILTKLGLYSGPRTNDAGFRDKGTEVSSLGSAQAGDVICYNGHIGFYDGHGGLIHEANSRDGCKHSDNAANRTILTIRRFAKSDTISNTATSTTTSKKTSSTSKNSKESSKTSNVPIPTDDFSTETREIITNHVGDFNVNTYRQFISNYPGGYDGYIKSLGGVFEKYGGIDNLIEVKTAGDLQEVAEYVWGLFSIWGFDYWNGDTYHAYGSDAKGEGLYENAYYPSHSYTGGGYSGGNIDKICSDPNKPMRTNCNFGIDSFLQKTTLIDHDVGASPGEGELVSNIDDLLVGDLVHMYKSDGWRHVAIVGERDPATGDVILYDAGNRYITTGKYKKVFKEFSGDDYSGAGYIRWVGRRLFDIEQTSNRSDKLTLKNTVYKVKVATWQDCKETVVSKGSGEKKKDEYVKESSEYTYSMNVRTIPFQDIVAQYKMPFNYLWSMLLISQDKKYVFDLADTVRNSKIEITVFDNLKETTTTQDENYVRHYDYTGEMTGQITTRTQIYLPSNPQIITTTVSDSAEYTLPDPYVFDKITTTYDRTNTLEVALTLADAWCVKYQKNYKYTGKTNTIGYPSTIELEDYAEDTITSDKITNSELEKILTNLVKQGIFNKAGSLDYFQYIDTFKVTKEHQELKIYVTDRKLSTKVGTVEYKYLAVPENATDNNANAVSGYLYSSSYSQIDTSKLNRSGIQQGFCLAGDYYAYVTESNEVSSLFLVDSKTNKQVDVIKGIRGHGNTLAYDSKENQIIFIQDETENMLIYKIENGKLIYLRTRKLPKHDAGGVYVRSDVSYNAQNDRFILGEYVYKRDAFFNRGSPEVKISYKAPDNTDIQGSCSYGNHIYYNYSSADYKSGNYLIACNIITGKVEEIIYDDMPRELEEGSFDKEGNLYLMYGRTLLFKTNYNYYADGNLDTSKVGNSANIGGGYLENNKFVNVLNKHPSAKHNIVTSTEWLFDIMENNSDTVNMIDLTKYFLYKATGIDFGVTDFMTAFGKLTQGFDEMSQVGGTSGIDGIPGQIYDFLLAKGVPPVGVAAILGNIQGESSFRPNAVNGIGCSGLCQWYKGRFDNLKALAASKGTDWTDVNTQMEYLWSELDNKYTGVRDVIMSADQESELEYATWYWGRYFEVFFLGDSFEATKGKTAKRYEYARYWYEQWKQHHTEGTASSVAFAHGSAAEKVKGLYPNGIPMTKQQAESYLITINVPITNKNGTKGSKGVRVHRAIAQDVYNACLAAQNSGFKIYDIGGYRTFGTDTAGRTGGLSYSQHCYGLAVDINPTENGQFKNGRATGNWFYDPGNNEYSIQSNSTLVKTFKALGWGWGGEWNSSKDYMHFSFMGT